MQEVAKAIFDELIADGVNGGVDIHQFLAPQKVSYPYIVISLVSSMEDNMTPTDSRQDVFQVKVLTDTPATARTVQAAIRSSLHKAELTVTGKTNFGTTVESGFYFVELLADKRIYHAGHDVRVRVHS